MRIRSIKPEFWRSQDISGLDVEDRLFFVGLWSYVDDNGVGEDRVSQVAADLFADDIERDPIETFARVSRGLRNLSECDLIRRYRVSGRSFLRVVNWSKHQRIDKPNKPRFPFENGVIAREFDESATSSRDSRDILAPGTEEQGNKGTEEQGGVPAPPKASPPSPFCARHQLSEGSDAPCRACGVAWKKYEEWQADQQPDGEPYVHQHRWLTDGTCVGCEEIREGS